MKRVILGVIIALFLSGCCTIKVPPTKETSDKEFATKLKANIEELKAKGEIEVSYKNKIDITYATLKDDHIGLLMWLQAARCESRAGNKELASKLYDYALASYNQTNPNSGVMNLMILTAPSTIGLSSRLSPDVAANVTKQILETWEEINK